MAQQVVREKAVEALCAVGEQIPAEHVSEYYADMLRRLSSGDWFTSRVSSCGYVAWPPCWVRSLLLDKLCRPCSLFPVAYGKLDDASVKLQLRTQFSALCHDETPMVRRAAASNLGKFAKVVSRVDSRQSLRQLLIRATLAACAAGGGRAAAFRHRADVHSPGE